MLAHQFYGNDSFQINYLIQSARMDQLVLRRNLHESTTRENGVVLGKISLRGRLYVFSRPGFDNC